MAASTPSGVLEMPSPFEVACADLDAARQAFLVAGLNYADAKERTQKAERRHDMERKARAYHDATTTWHRKYARENPHTSTTAASATGVA